MAYHSEVLQKERDMLRRNRLSSPRSAEMESLRGEKGDSSGARRAGGGSHRFSVMAEAALAQVKKQSPFCWEPRKILWSSVFKCYPLMPPDWKELSLVYGTSRKAVDLSRLLSVTANP